MYNSKIMVAIFVLVEKEYPIQIMMIKKYIAEFNKLFSIDERYVDVDKMDVSLENGVLRVVAPEKDISECESIRKLPIIEKSEKNKLKEEEKKKEKPVADVMKENNTPQAKTTIEYFDGLTITENTDEE